VSEVVASKKAEGGRAGALLRFAARIGQIFVPDGAVSRASWLGQGFSSRWENGFMAAASLGFFIIAVPQIFSFIQAASSEVTLVGKLNFDALSPDKWVLKLNETHLVANKEIRSIRVNPDLQTLTVYRGDEVKIHGKIHSSGDGQLTLDPKKIAKTE
jgi:hypothetical protein